MTIEQIKIIVTPILIRHGVTKAALFGSMATQTYTSDIDILIELDDTYSLLDFVGIKLDLEDALNKKVDLVEYRAVKPALRKYILESPVPIYG
jgi:predicted nucleotidyltransferase